MKCDFCSAPNPKHKFRAKSFNIAEMFVRSVEDWAACDICADLINENDRDGLLRRSIETFRGTVPRDAVRHFIWHIHDGFWKNKL